MQKKSTQDKCFYLIDDGYNFNEQVLIDFLVRKNYNPIILDIREYVNYLSEIIKNYFINIDQLLLLGVGTGGAIILDELSKIISCEAVSVCFSQEIINGQIKGYKYDICYDYIKNRNILLVDDVIYTGQTIKTLSRILNEFNANIVGVLSMLANRRNEIIKNEFSIINLHYESGIPFPVFSFRHLLLGEGKIEEFDEQLNKDFFDGDEQYKEIIKIARKGNYYR